MKSSSEWPDQAIEYAQNRIVQFTQSPLKDAHFFQGYLELALTNSGHSELDDFLPALLAKAEKDKLAFITAKRICAHFEANGAGKPRDLSVWLSDVLMDIKKNLRMVELAQINHKLNISFCWVWWLQLPLFIPDLFIQASQQVTMAVFWT
jgi:hypothetical protein